jgi:hypothetical protein
MKGSGRRLIRDIIQEWDCEQPRRPNVWILDVPSEIRTGRLLKSYRWNQLAELCYRNDSH